VESAIFTRRRMRRRLRLSSMLRQQILARNDAARSQDDARMQDVSSSRTCPASVALQDFRELGLDRIHGFGRPPAYWCRSGKKKVAG